MSRAARAQEMPSARSSAARRTATHLAALVLAVSACYANALRVPFVLDDEANIVRNPTIGTWAGGPFEPATRRVAYLTFKLDHLLYGAEPLGYHVTSIAVHLLAALAVYALARVLLRAASREDGPADGAATAALVGALLFAVHPVQTQAVTYVVQRLASLATLLYVAALALFAWARAGAEERPRRRAAYALALAAALLAVRTKEIAFTLPLAVALLEAAFGSGAPRRRALAVAPFLALLPVIPALVLGAGRPAGTLLAGIGDVTRLETRMSRVEYLATQARVVVTYLRLLVLPVGQNLDHDYPLERGFGSAAVLASAALVAAIAAGGAALLARRRPGGLRVAGFGILLFFLGLAVESSFVPIVDVIFEHRMYLPMAGAALAAAGLFRAVERRWSGARRWLVPAAALWLAALGVATVARNHVWRSAVSLWSDAAQKSPGKPRVHYNLGNALLEAGDLAGAERSWLRVVELDPRHSWALNQLGSLALVRGDLALAERYLRRSLDGSPVNPEAFYNLGLVLEATGREGEAIALYRRFVEMAPFDRAAEVARLRARLEGR